MCFSSSLNPSEEFQEMELVFYKAICVFDAGMLDMKGKGLKMVVLLFAVLVVLGHRHNFGHFLLGCGLDLIPS